MSNPELFDNSTYYVSNKIKCKYDEKNKLGEGGYGDVYCGEYDSKKVAIKRVLVNKAEIREIKAQMKLEHENILKIITVEQDDNFRYIVLELCVGTLRDVCLKKYEVPDLPSDRKILHDIAKGLNYIHLNKLVHRDIKPHNILISCTTPPQIKISDFGLSKETSTNNTFELSMPLRGSFTWMAPELIKLHNQQTTQNDIPKKDSKKSDIFSAGCVFFYYVTRGAHPYGKDDVEVMHNIRTNKQIYRLVKDHFASIVITSMTKSEPESRMSLEQVLEILDTIKEEHPLPAISNDEVFPWTSLLVKLNVRETFKEVDFSSEKFGIHQVRCAKFHPIDPVLACGLQDERVVLLRGADHSAFFSDWVIELELQSNSLPIKLEWNMNGTQLAAGLNNNDVVMIWRYPTGEILSEMGHSNSDSTMCIAWSSFDVDMLATYKWEGQKLLVWNSSEEDHLFYEFDSITDDIMNVQWISRNQIACSYEKGTIDIYRVDDGHNIAEFEHGDDVVWCMAWNEEKKYLASGSADNTIKIWSLECNDPVFTLNVGSDCFSLAWHLNGNQNDDDEHLLIAGGLGAGSVFIWDLKGPLVPRYLQGHSSLVSQVLFSSDQRFLASLCEDTGIIIWSAKTWESLYSLPVESQQSTLSWNKTSNKLTIGNKTGDRKLRVIEYVVQDL